MTKMTRGADGKITRAEPLPAGRWPCREHQRRGGWVSRRDERTGLVYYLCAECYQQQRDELARIYTEAPGSGPQPRALEELGRARC